MLQLLWILLFSFVLVGVSSAQTDSTWHEPKFNSYQIYLKKPLKEIREIQYFKDCQPIKGKISEDQKKVIMEDYIPGNKVYLQLIYVDGTEEEFVRSPCYIDPIIL